MVRYELLKLDAYIGVWNPVTKKRLENLYPTEKVTVKVKATAFEHGFRWMESTDLHELLKGKRFISPKKYKILLKKFGR